MSADLPTLIEAFFTKRLIAQQGASAHTIASYRDTFRLLLCFARRQLGKMPSQLAPGDLDTALLGAFLSELETNRRNTARSRNLRLAAIRSFFGFVAFEAPEHSALAARVLAMPSKRHERRQVDYLSRPEIEALLAAPNTTDWFGRRDHALLLTAVQTGLRLSELTSLQQKDVILGEGAHVRCMGKGRKERATPLTKPAARILATWMKEQGEDQQLFVFPNRAGGRLSSDAFQNIVRKHAEEARKHCPSLATKRVTPHVLRHTAAMELMQAGVDCSMIALWLGHASLNTTRIYLDANLALKEEVLAKASPVTGKIQRYKPSDRLLNFLNNL
ncbi:MAG: site-specific integrase [Kiritimatiellaeota bacterium]|nr:site-specific integrase [Kiritimatiellota bacterium]